jgi:hypothetical protein
MKRKEIGLILMALAIVLMLLIAFVPMVSSAPVWGVWFVGLLSLCGGFALTLKDD